MCSQRPCFGASPRVGHGLVRGLASEQKVNALLFLCFPPGSKVLKCLCVVKVKIWPCLLGKVKMKKAAGWKGGQRRFMKSSM